MKLSDARLAELEARWKPVGNVVVSGAEFVALLAEVREARDLLAPDPDPCRAEIHSWEVFRPEQMDPYYLTCDEVGDHSRHEDHETGGTWPVAS